jgi:ATP/maltotriose-dependent transcriptional regulator MalT
MPSTNGSAIETGRAAHDRQSWEEAYTALKEAGRVSELSPADLERLATAAHMVGAEAESTDAWTRAHYEYIRLGQTERALRCLFWMALDLLVRGQAAAFNGWLARGKRLLEGLPGETVEHGYILQLEATAAVFAGDHERGLGLSLESEAIALRFGSAELRVLSRHNQGQCLVNLGQTAQGLALLDEVMAGVMAGEMAPVGTGTLYCAVLSTCQDVFDFARAQEWTAALARWSASHPDTAPYRGQCLVYRLEVMQKRGAWPDAMEEAARVCAKVSGPVEQRWAGGAFYQQGELMRLRGEFGAAEAAYREASRFGWSPQPGLSLLRLAQGRTVAAASAIDRALRETEGMVGRSRLLPAHVEVMLAAGDVAAARASADELEATAEALGTPLLRALVCHCLGSVLLAEGDLEAGLSRLREARALWQELGAPYDCARSRALAGAALRGLGDEDGADLEFDAARRIFEDLGAAPDLARLDSLARPGGRSGGLTARELEVLRLVAAGKTNRAIAADLYLSEHTVRRHLQNVFAKLGVSTRAAATAHALQNGLV